MGPTITVTKRESGLKNFQNTLMELRKVEVLVGIPQATADRRVVKGKRTKINNAELLYIHTHGSPIRHIPPRPVIEPAIQASGNKQAIAKELKDAATAWMNRKPTEAKRFLQRAGTEATNRCKAWFTDPRNGWAPNAPSTIARKGSDRPLIDSGQLRRSIRWVLRGFEKMTSVQKREQMNIKLRGRP
ncbi:MAG: hypothetical protein ABSE84_01555 [Isosphaeraceae bacterium]|jgi:hypothetical protein